MSAYRRHREGQILHRITASSVLEVAVSLLRFLELKIHIASSNSGPWIFFISSEMPRPTERKEVLSRLRQSIADGKIIVGAGAGKAN